MRICFIPLVFSVFWFCPLFASKAPGPFSVADIFQSGMVLQRDQKTLIFGKGKEGAVIEVRLGAEKARAQVTQGKWRVVLAPHEAGGPHVLTLSCEGEEILLTDVLFGDVFLCGGQSNMEFTTGSVDSLPDVLTQAEKPQIRCYFVPTRPGPLFRPIRDYGSFPWVPMSPQTVKRFPAVGAYFSLLGHGHLKIPVGLISCNLGATPAEAWMSSNRMGQGKAYENYFELFRKDRDAFSMAEHTARHLDYEEKSRQYQRAMAVYATNRSGKPPVAPEKPKGPFHQRTPAIWFENMLLAVAPYTLKGVLWYQGEDNVGRPETYTQVMADLVGDWREVFENPKMPFLFAQLSAYGNPRITVDAWPRLREAQRKAWHLIPHSGMVVTLDVGDSNDIHPKRKAPVGQRFWAAAQQVVYGQVDGDAFGPDVRRAFMDGKRVCLEFDHATTGLIFTNRDSGSQVGVGFELAGTNGVFVAAQAAIEGSKVYLESPGEFAPAQVRYAWANYPQWSLYNKKGLPCGTFLEKVEGL